MFAPAGFRPILLSFFVGPPIMIFAKGRTSVPNYVCLNNCQCTVCFPRICRFFGRGLVSLFASRFLSWDLLNGRRGTDGLVATLLCIWLYAYEGNGGRVDWLVHYHGARAFCYYFLQARVRGGRKVPLVYPYARAPCIVERFY